MMKQEKVKSADAGKNEKRTQREANLPDEKIKLETLMPKGWLAQNINSKHAPGQVLNCNIKKEASSWKTPSSEISRPASSGSRVVQVKTEHHLIVPKRENGSALLKTIKSEPSTSAQHAPKKEGPPEKTYSLRVKDFAREKTTDNKLLATVPSLQIKSEPNPSIAPKKEIQEKCGLKVKALAQENWYVPAAQENWDVPAAQENWDIPALEHTQSFDLICKPRERSCSDAKKRRFSPDDSFDFENPNLNATPLQMGPRKRQHSMPGLSDLLAPKLCFIDTKPKMEITLTGAAKVLAPHDPPYEFKGNQKLLPKVELSLSEPKMEISLTGAAKEIAPDARPSSDDCKGNQKLSNANYSPSEPKPRAMEISLTSAVKVLTPDTRSSSDDFKDRKDLKIFALAPLDTTYLDTWLNAHKTDVEVEINDWEPAPVVPLKVEKPFTKNDDTPKGSCLVVIDTNVLLHNLQCVNQMRDRDYKSAQEILLVIPWVVLQELDYFKSDNSNKPQLKTSAKNAISFIHKSLTSKHPRLKGQFCLEDGKTKLRNDDEILKHCLELHSQKKQVVLLTEDKNLCNKAIVASIECKSVESVRVWLKLNETVSLAQIDQICGALNSKIDFSLKNVIAAAKYALIPFLTHILTTEMMASYPGKSWAQLDMREPPWKFQEIMTILDQNFTNVFSQVFLKTSRTLISTLPRTRAFYCSLSLSKKDTVAALDRCILLCQNVYSPKYMAYSTEIIETLKALLTKVSKDQSTSCFWPSKAAIMPSSSPAQILPSITTRSAQTLPSTSQAQTMPSTSSAKTLPRASSAQRTVNSSDDLVTVTCKSTTTVHISVSQANLKEVMATVGKILPLANAAASNGLTTTVMDFTGKNVTNESLVILQHFENLFMGIQAFVLDVGKLSENHCPALALKIEPSILEYSKFIDAFLMVNFQLLGAGYNCTLVDLTEMRALLLRNPCSRGMAMVFSLEALQAFYLEKRGALNQTAGIFKSWQDVISKGMAVLMLRKTNKR